jgi:hypothetical protein
VSAALESAMAVGVERRTLGAPHEASLAATARRPEAPAGGPR